jgi:hypothetical protein
VWRVCIKSEANLGTFRLMFLGYSDIIRRNVRRFSTNNLSVPESMYSNLSIPQTVYIWRVGGGVKHNTFNI